MGSEIIVNTNTRETRIALLENGIISELYVERIKDEGIVGNVYKGRVVKVLPGMQVSFVNIGLGKSGFLYVSDINPPDRIEEYEKLTAGEAKPIEDESPPQAHHAHPEPAEGQQSQNTVTSMNGEGLSETGEEDFMKHPPQQLPIEELLQEGQEILVQVSKDPIGNKGARITSYISLPGRYLVFMPSVDHVGISRRIEDEAERKRLKKLLLELKPPGAGFIVRTASEGKDREEFTADIEFLTKLWNDIKQKAEKASAPVLIHQDLNLIYRVIRDLFTKDVDKMIIDSQGEYENCIRFVDSYMPALKPRIELYSGKDPIFDAYGIEIEIERALGRKIWLKSGGYIIIEQTEALTAVDVNTGKFVGKKNPEETILKTNLEAVKEIVYQLRLRNIGGIIIIDFIDMEKEDSKEKVFHALEQALKSDRSRTKIIEISEFGLVEMTRKRVRDSLSRTLCQTCPYCEGRGGIKSPTTVCYEIFREVQRVINASPVKKKILINVPPVVADMLSDEESQYIDKLEEDLKIKIIVKADFDMHQEQYEITAL
ncbi:MAG: Rne/Rng family ribonuclease [Nitrospinae bacterium]|nr:Rne/Rng family ribonuclease [Nitrospinota bacterium]